MITSHICNLDFCKKHFVCHTVHSLRVSFGASSGAGQVEGGGYHIVRGRVSFLVIALCPQEKVQEATVDIFAQFQILKSLNLLFKMICLYDHPFQPPC